MLRVAKLLPAGKTSPPSKKLAVQWYYMTYHHADHAEYVKSGKKLATKTLKSLTSYLQALFAQKKANGMLKHAKLDCLCNREKRRLASNLCEKCKAHQTSYTRCELREHGRRDGSQLYR